MPTNLTAAASPFSPVSLQQRSDAEEVICIESDDDSIGVLSSCVVDKLILHVPASLGPEDDAGESREITVAGPIEVLPAHAEGGKQGGHARCSQAGACQDPPALEFRPRGASVPAGDAQRVIRVPVASVQRLDALWENVVLGLAPLLPVEAADPAAGGPVGLLVSELEVVAHRGTGRAVVAALRRWLPRSPAVAAEEAVLRLDGIVLTPRDVALLDDGEFLNDSILDFFLRLAMRTVGPAEVRATLYVASALFFQRLTASGAESGEEGWQNVRTWTRALHGLLGHEFIVLPVNELNLHWWLAVVCHPLRALDPALRSASAALSPAGPRIVCLDSMSEPVPKDGRVAFLRGFLQREWHERQAEAATARALRPERQGHDAGGSSQPQHELGRLGLAAPPTSGTIGANAALALRAVDAQVPTQENGFDCGVFVLEFLTHLLRSPASLAELGLAQHREWFEQAHVSHRRERLRWIAARLQHEARARGEPDAGKLLRDPSLEGEVARALTDGPPEPQRPGVAPDAAGPTPKRPREGERALPLTAKARTVPPAHTPISLGPPAKAGVP